MSVNDKARIALTEALQKSHQITARLSEGVTLLNALLTECEKISTFLTGNSDDTVTEAAPPIVSSGMQQLADELSDVPYSPARVITRATLGALLSDLVRQHGKPAQEFMKDSVLKHGNTQALSQVPESALLAIWCDAMGWKAAHE